MRKRKIAIALITALVMSLTPMSVLAVSSNDIELTDPENPSVSGNIGGDADITETVKLDVFKVKVTTLSDTDFVVDPQGLLNKADSANYKLGKGAVYFGTGDTSDEIKFQNLSSMDIGVELKVSATVSGNNVKMVETEEALTTETSPAVYLALSVSGNDVSGNDDVKATFTTTEQTVNESLEAVPEATVSGNDVSGNDAYSSEGYALMTTDTESTAQAAGNYATVTVDGTNKYLYYGLTAGYDLNDADAVSYVLSGKCNSVDAWDEAQSDEVKTNLVWKVTKSDAVTEIYAHWYPDNGGASFISMTPFDEAGVAENPGFAGKTLEEFKVNGFDAPYHIDSEGYNAGYIYITDQEAIDSGVPNTETVYTITFTCDGKKYKAVSR